MLDQLVKRAREEKAFSREDTPTEQRVEAALLYHLGLSYRQVGEWFGHSHQAEHEWYTALADLFEPEPDEHRTVMVDETKVAVEDREVYVWAALDRHTYEVIHVEVSPGRSDLDALLFLRTVLERCRGCPVIVVDRGPWYNWSLDELDLPCEARRETWGDRSIVEPWFGLFKLRTRQFFDRFPYAVRTSQSIAGRKRSPTFIMRGANADTLLLAI